MSKRHPRVFLAVVGALSFWLPDVIAHSIAGQGFDAPQVRLLTFLMPVGVLTAYLALRNGTAYSSCKFPGVTMVVGVWLTGGLFMSLAWTAGGARYSFGDFLMGVALMAVPPITLMASAYDGSLFALLVVSFGSLLVWAVRNSGMPIRFDRQKQKV